MIDRYVVAGNPVTHSLSPDIHGRFAQQTGERLEYGRLAVPQGQFERCARKFFEQGGCGMNVTVPCKLDAYRFADELSENAQAAGAVNTLWPVSGGRIRGDNTDGVGLVRDIEQNLGWDLTGKRILILGAGGAVRGILRPLLARRPVRLLIANRTLHRAEELVREFGESSTRGQLQAQSFSTLTGRFDLILHATSAGLSADSPVLPDTLIGPDSLAYDLFYAPEPTPFLRWATQCGARNWADGLGMLVEQAAEAFWLWRGKRPSTGDVLSELRRTYQCTVS